MQLSNGMSQLRFQVDHFRATSRRLLTPLTNRSTDRPKLSAMIAPKDTSPTETTASTTPIAPQMSPIEADVRFQIMIAMVEYLSGKSFGRYQQTFSAIGGHASNRPASL